MPRFTEELIMAGNQLMERLQELVRQGNIRRLILRDQQGRTLLEVPLTLGVIGGASVALFAPFLAAVGAIAALISRVQVVIERYEDPADAAHKSDRPTIAELDASDRLKE
ncbi:MAG: DUF4342 domain-containing protein [Chloroflexi bacterium]|nr:DUF4342 domain-containing protein [Chloroflexota bacterium]